VRTHCSAQTRESPTDSSSMTFSPVGAAVSARSWLTYPAHSESGERSSCGRSRGFAPRPCPKISQRSSGLASLPARRLRRVPKPEGTHTPPTPHGGKVDDPRQRTPQPRRPSTADPTLPYPTDRTRRSRDGHLSRVRVEGARTRPVPPVAAAMGISRACASRWVNRWRRHGDSGLRDRSSTPHRSPNVTPAWVVKQIETWRREHKWSAQRISDELAD